MTKGTYILSKGPVSFTLWLKSRGRYDGYLLVKEYDHRGNEVYINEKYNEVRKGYTGFTVAVFRCPKEKAIALARVRIGMLA